MKNTWLILIGLFLSVKVQASDVYFRHLGVKEGLSQVNILSIYQDSVGVMWFGSSEGLNRYNGDKVKIFRPSQNNQGLTNNEINELQGNKERALLYIRSVADLVRFDLRTETFQCIGRKNIQGIHSDNDTLWVLHKNAVSYYLESDESFHPFVSLPEEWGAGMGIYSDNGTIWVATRSNLLRISKSKQKRIQLITPLSLGRKLYKDSAGNMWVGTWKGLYRVDVKGAISYFDENTLSDLQVRSIVEDNTGCIWIGTFGGLNKYNPSTNEWRQYQNDDTDLHSLSHNSIFALYKDMQGSIWVGTYFGGINYFNPEKAICNYYRAVSGHQDCLNFPFVGKMVEDDQSNLWICTEGGGLNCLNRATGLFTYYQHKAGDKNSIGHNNLKNIYYHPAKQSLYIGTHTGGLSIFDLTRKTFRTLRQQKEVPSSLPNDIVSQIQAYQGKLLVLTLRGLSVMDFEKETFEPFEKSLKIEHLFMQDTTYETFLVDSKERLWLAKSNGGIVCIDLRNGKIKDYVADEENPFAIGKFKVVHIYENKTGDIFFGTIGSGLFKYITEKQSFRKYGTANQKLLSDYCYYISESPEYGHLMILHSKGVSFFDPIKEEVKRTYNLFQLNFCQGSSVYTTKNGETFLGGINGMTSFYENRLFVPTTDYQLYFDRLLLYNKEVIPGDESGILSQTLDRTHRLKLDHDQNNISIEFCSSNYFKEEELMYEYRLEGFDKEWIPAYSHLISYTNLNPGKYTLVVREMKPDIKSLRQVSLQIEIASPFYATPLAYLLYVLLFGGIMYVIIRFKYRQAQLTASLEFERKEKLRIEELNQIKLRFFTNISHEFRTPLTLIIGQIELLLQSDKIGTVIYNRVLKIYKNAWHMRNLISELLDFRKQEQGYLNLRVECNNIIGFTKEIYMCFYEYAQKRQITYRFDCMEEKIEMWFDPVQLQKVIFNLLSNAFKYTDSGGKITVIIRRSSSFVTIEVKDTGSGIPMESVDKVFERFYQTDQKTSVFTLGTGIGLALAKGIVELHKGNITVESKQGEGSLFSVTLLLGNRHFSEEELRPAGDILPESALSESLPVEFAMTEVEEATDDSLPHEGEELEKPIILIVEDSEELLHMLSEIFSPMYKVYTACNGREGFEQVQQLHPDLVLSDVMMPELTGKELCYKIKNSIELSSVPVVLLTAQNSVEYIVEGYMFGADDYVTKPFNVKVLIARCNNLIRNKKRLMKRLANQPAVDMAEATALSGVDKELIEKSIHIIRANFDNTDFDVNVLASELCMGRSKLYIKFKEMVGLTPNEFILKVKLDEGMRLLKEHPELNIAEISYRLGFSSGRYFSKCFKSFYGAAPLTMRKG
ncbi:MAG: ATP-binding protein [Bacteroides sp.]